MLDDTPSMEIRPAYLGTVWPLQKCDFHKQRGKLFASGRMAWQDPRVHVHTH